MYDHMPRYIFPEHIMSHRFLFYIVEAKTKTEADDWR